MKKGFLVLGMCGIIGISTITTYGLETNEIIAQKAPYKILVEGNEFTSNNPVVTIDGSTYLPLKDLGEALDVKVNWNAGTKQVEITQKNIVQEIQPLEDNNKLALIDMHPSDGSEDIYLKWGYLTFVFNAPMKGITNVDKIYLLDESGNRIKVKSGQPGATAKDNLILSLEKSLELNTNYKLIIPKEIMISEDGNKFGVPIDIEFKTASNVVRGTIQSDESYFKSQILLKGKEGTYTSQVVGQNEFFFVNIPEGKYDLILQHDGLPSIECEINVKNNKINIYSIK